MSLIKDFFNNVNFKGTETAPPPPLIFLCGGEDSKNLKDDEYFRPHIHRRLKLSNPNVFRAEDVMNWQVSQEFKKDLLELEKYVAALVSLIPIVCESEGSIAELGAFVSDEIIRKKLYIIIEEKFYVGRDSESFIRWGPIENFKENVDRRKKTKKKGKKKGKKNTNENKLYCFSKPINENDLTGVCNALRKCKPETSKCNFSNNYFHILLLIDIINILSVATITEIKSALSHALVKAEQKPLKNYEQIEGMLVVLKELGLIKERNKGEGIRYFIAKQKEFYLDYKYKIPQQNSKASDIKKQIVQEIYLTNKVKTSILKEEKRKNDISWLKKPKFLKLKKEHRASVLKKAPLLYKVYDIPKKSGGTRTIAQPTLKLKQLQTETFEKLQKGKKLPVHPCAKAYIKGVNGILANARAHKDSKYFFKYDFKDFFPSIKAADFNIQLEKAGYSEPDRIDLLKTIFRFKKEESKEKTRAVYRKLYDIEFNQNTNPELLKLMIEDYRDEFQLSIGAPSSPFVSNAIMFDFDTRMDKWAKENDFIYTRFADDITISSQKKQDSETITAKLNKTLKGLDYPTLQLNDSKQKYVSFKNRVTITGLNITPDHKVSLGRKKKKEISAMIHHYKCKKLLLYKINELRGWLAYAKAVDNNFFKSMQKKYTPECIASIMKKPKYLPTTQPTLKTNT